VEAESPLLPIWRKGLFNTDVSEAFLQSTSMLSIRPELVLYGHGASLWQRIG
jgi:hypothetical protein